MADNFTAKFKVDISDLKKNITEAENKIKTANATFKSQTAGMDKWTSNADGLSKKLEQLDTVLKSQKTILSSYKSQLAEQQKAYSENGSRVEQLKAKLKDLADNGVKKTDEEYKKYASALKSVIKEQENNEKAAEALKIKILNQEAAIGKTENSIKHYTAAQKSLEKEASSLTSKIEKQEKELEDLRKDYIDVAAAEGKDSAEAKDLANKLQKLSTELKQNKNAVEGAKAEADKYDNSLEKVGKEAEKTERKLSGLGAKIGGAVKSGLFAAGKAAAGAATGLAAATVSAGKYADTIRTLSAKTGLSTGKLQEYNYAAELVDVSTETLTKSMAKNIKSMANARDGSDKFVAAYKKLGVSVTNADGSLRDSEQVYWDSIDALGKIKNATDRDALAMQLFGKSAQDLNPLIKTGSKRLKELTGEAKGAGAVMSGKSLKALNNFDDSLQKLKSGAKVAKNALGTILLPQLQELADSGTSLLGNFAKNVTKANGDWGKIGKAIGNTVGKLIDKAISFLNKNLPKIGDALMNVIQNVLGVVIKRLPQIISTVSKFIQQLFKWIGEALPKLIKQLVDQLPAIIEGLDIGGLISSFVDLLSNIVKAIPEVTAKLVQNMPQIITAIVKGLAEGAVKIFNAAGEMFSGILTAADDTQEQLDKKVNGITTFVDKLTDTAPQLADYNKLVSKQGKTIADLDSGIQETENKITEEIKKAIKEQGKLRDEDIKKIDEYIKKIQKLEEQKLEIYRSQQLSELRKIELESNNITQKAAAQHLKNADEALKKSNGATEKAYSSRLAIIESKYTEEEKKTSDKYKKEQQAAKSWYDSQIADNNSYYTKVLNNLEVKSAEWVKADQDKWTQLRNMTSQFSTDSGDDVKNWINSMYNYGHALDGVKNEYIKSLKDMDLNSASGFLKMVTQAKDSGAKINKSTKATAYNILANFDNLPTQLDEAGKKTLLGLIKGMEKQIPELKDTSDMSANEIVDTIKKYLGISENGESTKTKSVGKTAGKSLSEGVKKGAEENADKAEKGGKKIAAAAKQGLNGKDGNKMSSAGKTAGKNLLQGFSNALIDNTITGQIKKRIKTIGADTLITFQNSLEEKSPSKATERMGRYFIQGFTIGTQKESKSAETNLTTLGNSLITSLKFKPSQAEKASAEFTKSMTAFYTKSVKKSAKEISLEVGADLYDNFKALKSKFIKSLKANPANAENLGASFLNNYIGQINRAIKTSKKEFSKSLKSLTEGQSADIQKLYSKLEKGAVNSFGNAMSNTASKFVEKLKTKITNLTSAMQQEVAAVQSDISSLQTKLSGGFGDLYTMTTDKNGNSKMVLNNIWFQVKSLKKYGRNLKALKGKVADSLLQKVAEMSPEEGLQYTNELLKMSKKELKDYNSAYQTKEYYSKKIANSFYADKLKEVKNNYINKIKDAFKSANNSIKNLGKNSIEGFVKGMKKANYSKELQGVSADIVKAMKKSLGIKSPSKVFRDELGKNSALGFEVGFVGEMKNVVRNMQASLAGLTTELQPVGATSNNYNTSNVQNFYQTINASHAPTRYELYRQTKNLLGLAKRGI